MTAPEDRPQAILAGLRTVSTATLEFITFRVALGDSLAGPHPLSDARRPDYEAWLGTAEPDK